MKQVMRALKKAERLMNQKAIWLFAVLVTTPGLSAFAQKTSAELTGVTNKAKGGINWPFEAFLMDIIDELSGPIPMIVGTLALIGAVGALLVGNSGEATKKILMLVIAVSIMLQAPYFISMITQSAGAVITTGM